MMKRGREKGARLLSVENVGSLVTTSPLVKEEQQRYKGYEETMMKPQLPKSVQRNQCQSPRHQRRERAKSTCD